MEDIFGILIFIAFWGAVIAIIVNKKKKKKKTKEPSTDEKFKELLVTVVNNFENNDDYFSNMYEMWMENEGIDKAQLDLSLTEIPQSKIRFSNVCHELANIGKTNICLKNDNEVDISEKSEQRVTQDIIEVLPCLARFYKEYDFLYSKMYDGVLEKIVLNVNSASFGWAFDKEEKYKTPEDYQNLISDRVKMVDGFLDIRIDTIIRKIVEVDSDFDVRNSDRYDIKYWVDMADRIKESEGLSEKFLDIWVRKMQNIARKYSEAYLELYEYFKGMNEEMEKTLPWFSVHYFYLPSHVLSLKENTEKECLRVLELYTSGKMKGSYSEFGEKLALKFNK